MLGNDDAATQYLTGKTQTTLYDKFYPVIKNSFAKVGAEQIWENLIHRYNNIPFTKDVNPDLTDYVTGEALKGVYTIIAIEEKEIRTKLSSRTTDLLKKVLKELPEVRPLYFKRPDSGKLFGIPPRVLEDLAMKKIGPAYFRRGKYSIYEVDTFEKWLTQNPIKTSNDYE